jgi:hypothetical protein
MMRGRSVYPNLNEAPGYYFYCSKLSAQLNQVKWTWVISALLTAVRATVAVPLLRIQPLSIELPPQRHAVRGAEASVPCGALDRAVRGGGRQDAHAAEHGASAEHGQAGPRGVDGGAQTARQQLEGSRIERFA